MDWRLRFSKWLKQYRRALTSVVLVLFVVLNIYILSPEQINSLLTAKQMVTILVAEFEGKDSQNYYVTDNILSAIRQKTASYKDVRVLPLGKAITERDGKTVARQVGQEKKADIVIWGWYGTTKERAQVSVHFELLTKLDDFPELGEEAQGKIRMMPVRALDRALLGFW